MEQAVNARDEEDWQALETHFAALRRANNEARADVPTSGYDLELTARQFDEESQRFIDCETRIREALASYSVLTWWVKRPLLGKHCREVYSWFDRSTDDNFNWTQQAQAIRTARDEVARCLKALGF